MSIARFSRALLFVGVLALFLAAIACESDEPDTGAVDTDTAAVQATAVPVAPEHDNGDDDKDSMRMEEFDLAAVMELVGTFAAMADKSAMEGKGDLSKFGVIGDSQNTGIWVNGAGSVSAAPDLVELDLGVSATADTVSEARASAAGAMTAVIGFLQGSGVADADIRTQHISIQPQYDWQEIFEESVRRSERVLTGYQVSNTVRALVRDLDSTSELLDGAVAAGGDLIRVNGITFRIEDTTELAKQAREMAVEDALTKASELASYSEVVLGRMVYLSEVVAQPVYAERAFASVAADTGASTPISPGEQEVRVTVQAVFDIESS
ncbi:MAG: SIMPL domain-containing protein [Chloroflexi bacterium]|nr:SIMPL domain-containing protein [Chloroflexota bacterium]